MKYKPMFGTDLVAFLQGGPEREGLTEIPLEHIMPVLPESPPALAKASSASRRIMLQFIALNMSIDRHKNGVKETDLVSLANQFDEEHEEFFSAGARILKSMLMTQLKLDARAAGHDTSSIVMITIDQDMNVIAFTDELEAAAHILHAATEVMRTKQTV